jgi:hypothetical protein
MPFIGKQPEIGAYSKLDAITTSATATYNLTLGGGAYYPSSANHLLVSLNGVMQAPQDSFTVSGSTIVFASALASTDSIDFIMALGDVLDIGTPSDGTVTSSKLAGPLTTPSNLTVGGTVQTTGVGPGADHFKVTGTDNLVVGAVGNTANDVNIYSNSVGHNGLRFHSSGILPTDNTGSIIDADADLGISTHRFKDIYLSGGVNFSANANAAGMTSETLDDYEEGTWTPSLIGSSSESGQSYQTQLGDYTKIGNVVHCRFAITMSAAGTFSGYHMLNGMPFNIEASPNTVHLGSVYFVNAGQNIISVGLQGYENDNKAYLWIKTGASASREYSNSSFITNNLQITGSFTIQTTS